MEDAHDEVLLLQETKATKKSLQEFRIKAKKRGYILHGHAYEDDSKSHSCGVLIAWKTHLEVRPSAEMPSSNRTTSICLKTRAAGWITLASAYLPPKSDLAPGTTGAEIMQSILSAAEQQGARLIVGGGLQHSAKPHGQMA